MIMVKENYVVLFVVIAFLVGGLLGYYFSADIGYSIAEEQCFDYIEDHACLISDVYCYNISGENDVIILGDYFE